MYAMPVSYDLWGYKKSILVWFPWWVVEPGEIFSFYRRLLVWPHSILLTMVEQVAPNQGVTVAGCRFSVNNMKPEEA